MGNFDYLVYSLAFHSSDSFKEQQRLVLESFENTIEAKEDEASWERVMLRADYFSVSAVETAFSRSIFWWYNQTKPTGSKREHFQSFMADLTWVLSGIDYREEPELDAIKARILQENILTEEEFNLLAESYQSPGPLLSKLGEAIIKRVQAEG